MIKPNKPANEKDRLKALRSYGILDTESEVHFDSITRLAAMICDVPICLISLIDDERQWFKSKIGLEISETSRETSFCGHAILQTDVLYVEDATQDPRFSENPYVIGPENIKFYAGNPLIDDNGFALGTLCVVDNKPRTLTEKQLEQLRLLSGQLTFLIQCRMETKKKDEAYALLNHTSKMATLGEVASGIAHEINNPLAIIKTSSQQIVTSIIRKDYDEEKLIRYFSKINQASDRIAKIVKGLKFFTSNELSSDFKTESIGAIIDDTISLCADKFKNHDVELILNFPDELKNLMIDCRAVELSQVVLNLLNNAFDAVLPLKIKWIEISISESNDTFAISISDSGKTIKSEDVVKFMTPFYTTKAAGKGSGLGLNISQRIVESHGGKLWVDSSAHNSCFVVEISKKVRNLAAA